MKLGTKISMVTCGMLVASILILTLIFRSQLLSDCKNRMEDFKTAEYAKVQKDLQGYVDMAHRILSDNYEAASQNDYIIKNYGTRLRFIVESAECIIREKIKAVDRGEMTKEEAQAEARALVRVLRPDSGKGYVWINDTSRPYPRMVMHPTAPSLEGKIMNNDKYNCAMGEKKNLFVAFADVCEKDGEGYVDYLWPKPTENGLTQEQPKLSYVKVIGEWDWIIGTGIYVDDARELAVERAAETIRNMRYDGGQGYFWINDMTRPYPKMVMHPTASSLEGKVMNDKKYNCALGRDENLFIAFADVCEKNGAGFVDYKWPKPLKEGKLSEPLPKESYVKLFEPLGWIIGTGVYTDNIDAAIGRQQALTRSQTNSFIGSVAMITLILLVIASSIVIFLMRNLLTRPVSKVVSHFKIMEGGDFSQKVDEKELARKDEIGDVFKAAETLNESIQKMMAGITSGVQTLVSSATQLSAVSTQMSSSSHNTSENSIAVAAAAEEMETNMKNVSMSMENASSSIQMIVSAAEEMTSTIQEIAGNTSKGNEITQTAVKTAEGVSQKVNNLGIVARDINNVTDTISEISEQTNLLALNATIEAARAGEAGKGFAVVAGEIKDLAQQTANATNEINAKISGIEKITVDSVSAIEEIVKVISEINGIMSTVASSIEQQSATAHEIAQNVGLASEEVSQTNNNMTQISSTTSEVTQNISKVSTDADQISTSSEEISDSAAELSRLAETLEEMLEQFKTR